VSADQTGSSNRLKALHSWPRTAAGILVSAALLAWILRGADWGAVVGLLRRVPLWCIIGSLGIYCISVPLRALQWQWLVGSRHSATYGKTLRALCLGDLGNAVLPVRSGEIVKAYLLSRTTRLPFAGALTSTALARVQDCVPILTVLVLMLASTSTEEGLYFAAGTLTEEAIAVPGSRIREALWTLATGTGLLALALMAAYYWRDRIGDATTSGWGRVSGRVARWWGRLSGQVSEALAVVGQARRFWGAQGLAVVCWGLFMLAPLPILAAFGLSAGSLARTAIAVTGLTTITHVLPAAPAAVGTFHFACMVGLFACNPQMDRDAALAASLLVHAVDTASTVLPGLAFLSLGWQDLRAPGKGAPAGGGGGEAAGIGDDE
jgi:uncharacterized membrane protein YbhN (UPF0104 family)